MNKDLAILAKTLEKSIDTITRGAVEMNRVGQEERTNRVRIKEDAITDRIRIQEEAKIIHHKIDEEHDKFIMAMLIDEKRKDEMYNTLNSILLGSNELSDNQLQICLKLLDVLSQPGANVGQLMMLHDDMIKLLN